MKYRWEIELIAEQPDDDTYWENVPLVGTTQEAHEQGQALADTCGFSVAQVVLHRCGEVSND
jgi:hypothetical protein